MRPLVRSTVTKKAAYGAVRICSTIARDKLRAEPFLRIRKKFAIQRFYRLQNSFFLGSRQLKSEFVYKSGSHLAITKYCQIPHNKLDRKHLLHADTHLTGNTDESTPYKDAPIFHGTASMALSSCKEKLRVGVFTCHILNYDSLQINF